MTYSHIIPDDDYDQYLSNIAQQPLIASDHQSTSRHLKFLIRSGYLKYSDIVENPEKFLEAHRRIANHDGLEGFSVKFTVQYNLFAGSIMTLGTEKQKKFLIDKQKDGDLGCFMLTEYSAGVMSGMIVNTHAEIIDDKIVINTPNIIFNTNNEVDFEQTVHRKNWISQGLTARWGVVVAKLFIKGRNLGIYPFFIDMESKGIYKKDNGPKTGINGLDNAQIVFHNLTVPKNSIMLDDLDKIVKDPKHNPKSGFMRIASRLNSGRLCIADSLLSMVMRLTEKTKTGPLSKTISLSEKHQMKLIEVPEIRDILQLIDKRLFAIKIFIDGVKQEYCDSVRAKKYMISQELVEKIMVAKILSIDYSISVVNTLRKKIGSSALFAKNGLGSNLDILLCGRFAEGDNDILIRKLVMDRIKNLKRSNFIANFFRLYVKPISNTMDEETYALLQFASSIQNDKSDLVLGFNTRYRSIKSCAELICYNIIVNNLPPEIPVMDREDIKSMM